MSNVYRENGYNDREDYLSCIAEDYGLDLEQVVRPLADLEYANKAVERIRNHEPWALC